MAKSVVCDTRNGLGFPGNEVHHLNETVDAGCVAKVPGVVGLIISTVWGGGTWLSSRKGDHIFTLEKHLVVFEE